MYYSFEFDKTREDLRQQIHCRTVAGSRVTSFIWLAIALFFGLTPGIGTASRCFWGLYAIFPLIDTLSPGFIGSRLALLVARCAPLEHLKIQLTDDGIRFQQFPKPDSSPDTHQADWTTLAQQGMFEEIASAFLIRSPRGNGKSPAWELFIPKRLFATPADVNQFREAVLKCLTGHAEADNSPLFDLSMTTTPDDDFPISRLVPYRRLGLRVGAILFAIYNSLFLFEFYDTEKLGWLMMTSAVLLSVSVIYLIGSETFWEKLFQRWFGRPVSIRIRIDGAGISASHRLAAAPTLLYGSDQFLSWNSLESSGEMDETSQFFLLEYPRRKGRIPIRSCWIPKRAFWSNSEIDEFRNFAQAKIHGTSARREVSSLVN